MKIAMLVNNLEVSGGYQKLVIRLSQQLQKMRHEVTVFTPKLNTKDCYPKDINELRVITVPAEFSQATPVTAYQALVSKITSDFEAFIIHDELSLIGIGLLPFKPKKVVWMLNNQLPEDLVKYRSEVTNVYRQVVGPKKVKIAESKKAIKRVSLIRKGLKRTDVLLTYDSFNKALARRILHRDAIIVYAGADLEQFKESAKNRKFQTKKSYLILSVGVIFPHRRYEDLIQAVSLLVKASLPVKLIIIGRQDLSPNYFDQLEKLTKQLSLQKYVVFKNYVDDKQMIDTYKDSDIFAFVNDGFTWGISVFEAVAAKLPVIITSNIGAADLIKNDATGWVVEPRSPNQIVKAIEEIIADRSKAKKIADSAYNEIINTVSWDAYAKRILGVINS